MVWVTLEFATKVTDLTRLLALMPLLQLLPFFVVDFSDALYHYGFRVNVLRSSPPPKRMQGASRHFLAYLLQPIRQKPDCDGVLAPLIIICMRLQ